MSAGDRLRIGILGAGVSGMTAAWLLQHDHAVTILEKAPRLGGHAEMVPVVVDGKTVHGELGPRFFFDPSYPFFLAFLRLLGVPTRWNDARVSISDVATGSPETLVLPPRTPRHVARLLRSPRGLGHVLSLRRLIGAQLAVSSRRDWTRSLSSYLTEEGYPGSFGPEFAYPFLAACWGAPLASIGDFPAYSLLKGMPPGTRPGFFEIEGGTAQYMAAFAAELTHVDVRLGAGVVRVERLERGDANGSSGPIVVEDERGERHDFDHLIVATSSRDAARLLRGVPRARDLAALVGQFRHFDTDIVLHGDPAYMPTRRADWSHHNLFFDRARGLSWMSDWQGLRADVPVFRTWLPKDHRLPEPLYARRGYHHLVMTPENAVLQRKIAALQGASGFWLAGMYAADVDNHESALLSAIVPGRALAPRSRNLARLLAAVPSVGAGAIHGLDVLPTAQARSRPSRPAELHPE